MKKNTLIIIVVLVALTLAVAAYMRSSYSKNYSSKDSLGAVNPGFESTQSDGVL